ncbi:Isochorismatase hydrolase [Rhizoclosmatium globosum]|uniref:Isochorismatase hydrolase n=1 Tax=Rhizoclosmatium globosum TaxID=329046 RepID=A0A1Y2AVB9_9FUNG|nr:Isochorismatase hydrolase [Rhizoclosmatium globosum]|eukprot:ORY25865.1 Isochorismatase hydrolase [Rhizoclosmatium globosum]
MAPVPVASSTALLVLNNQLGFRDNSVFGPDRSTPNYGANIAALLSAFRETSSKLSEGSRPLVIHVQYRPVWTDHPLHESKLGPFGQNAEELVYSIDEVRRPKHKDAPALPDEIIMSTHGHNPFINSPLESILNKRGIKTLLVCGMQTDVSVSSVVRTAQNLALTGKFGGRGNMADAKRGEDGLAVEMARIILIQDATRSFGKGGLDAETVQRVHVESLKEFAEVWNTSDVLAAFQ